MTTNVMKRFRTIASSAVLFGAVGPAIGSLVVLGSRGGDFSSRLLPLSYVFGILPALVAGVIYGVMRLRAQDTSLPWYFRAARGAAAGLMGCLIMVILGSIYTLVTASVATLRSELGFYFLTIVSGVTAGAVCALFIGHRRRRAVS